MVHQIRFGFLASQLLARIPASRERSIPEVLEHHVGILEQAVQLLPISLGIQFKGDRQLVSIA